MRKFIFVYIFLVWSPFIGLGQQINGVVYYFNSGGKTAEGVKISALGSNSVYSNSNGIFILSCPNKKVGQKVKLIIGSVDAAGKKIEVVNTHDLNLLRVSDNVNEDPVEIIVCYSGQRDETARRYYGIFKTCFDNEHAKILKSLENKIKDDSKTDNEVRILNKKIEDLQNHYDEALEKLEERAQFISNINLDNASEIVKSAVKKIDSNDFDSALAILDSAKLVDAYTIALAKKISAENEIDQIIEGYELKISLLYPKFLYKEIILCYEQIIAILSADINSHKKLAQIYRLTSQAFQILGEYPKALELQQKSIDILEKSSDIKFEDLSVAYNNISLIYGNLGMNDSAFKFQQKSIKIAEEVFGIDNIELAILYNNMGLIYLRKGEYKLAMEYEQRAINIQKQNPDSLHPNLAVFYNNLGSCYFHLSLFREEVAILQKAAYIREKTLNANDPKLANIYNSLSMAYNELKKHDTALFYIQKTISIWEAVFGPKHVGLVLFYSNYGSIYAEFQQIEKAIEYYDKSIKIGEEIIGFQPPDLILAYTNIGLLYQKLNKNEFSLRYFKKAIVILESTNLRRQDFLNLYGSAARSCVVLGFTSEAAIYWEKLIQVEGKIAGPINIELAIAYSDAAIFYREIKNYSKALFCHQKSIGIAEEILIPNDVNLSDYFEQAAITHQSFGENEAAIFFHHKSIAILEQNGDTSFTRLVVSYANCAMSYKLLYRFSDALKYNEKCIAIQEKIGSVNDPSLAQHYYLRGILNYYLAKHPDAIKYFIKSVEISPEIKKRSYYSDLGMAYAKLHEFIKADSCFKEFQKLFPDNATTYLNWSMYYSLKDVKEKAIQNLQKAIALGYADIEWLKQDESMDNIRGERNFITILEKMSN